MLETHILTVWFCDLRGVCEPDMENLCRILDPAEQDFASRLKNRNAQARYIASHTLSRLMVAELTGLKPDGLVYRSDANGTPAFDDVTSGARFPISLSRTDGLVASAYCPDFDFGIDVEQCLPANADRQLVQSMFSEPEQQIFQDLDGEEFEEAFFKVWTLKEAYVKAEGLGLSLPLHDFAFSLEPLGIRFLSNDRRNKNDWSFMTQAPTLEHRLSVAVRTKGAPLEFLTRHVTLSELISESGKGNCRQ